MGMGVNIPMVYRPLYPWYIDPPTNGISTPLPYTIIDLMWSTHDYTDLFNE